MSQQEYWVYGWLSVRGSKAQEDIGIKDDEDVGFEYV